MKTIIFIDDEIFELKQLRYCFEELKNAHHEINDIDFKYFKVILNSEKYESVECKFENEEVTTVAIDLPNYLQTIVKSGENVGIVMDLNISGKSEDEATNEHDLFYGIKLRNFLTNNLNQNSNVQLVLITRYAVTKYLQKEIGDTNFVRKPPYVGDRCRATGCVYSKNETSMTIHPDTTNNFVNQFFLTVTQYGDFVGEVLATVLK